MKESRVFICNFPPRTERKLRLRYKDVKDVNNNLIHASVTGFPRDSVLADKPAFDLTIQAMSGMMHITGETEGPPTKVGYAITDVLTAHQITQGILAALPLPGGRQIETNMLHTTMYNLSYVAASWLLGGKDYRRQGNQHPLIAPYSVFRAACGNWIVIGVATDKQFDSLAEVLGFDDAQRKKYTTNEIRL